MSDGTVAVSYHTLGHEQPMSFVGIRALEPERPSSDVACIYLPGRYANSTPLTEDGAEDIRAHLAHAGFRVYSVDYRTHLLDEEAADAVDMCAAWRTRDFLEDVAVAAGWVRARTDRAPLILVAHSMGVKLAYLLAARASLRPAGLVALDGWLRVPDPEQHGGERASVREALERWRSGEVRVYEAFDDVPAVRARLARALDAPTDREGAAFRRFVAGTLGRARGAGRLTALPARPEDVDRLLRTLLGYDRYWPAAQVLELRSAALGIHEPELEPFDDDLALIDVPLLNVVAAARGEPFVERSRFTAGLCRNAPRTELVLDGFGHLDVVASRRVEEAVARPVAEWLARL
jgi:pimeloyl-ACP methyl ester carboxylesterase